MTKSALIEIMAGKLPHIAVKDVELVVNTVFDSMVDALNKGDRIEIRGFGSFSLRQRKARVGRNPKTGDSISIMKKRVPFFVVGRELRIRVNNNRRSDTTPSNG